MFKNAIPYAITRGYAIDHELLMRRPAIDPGPHDASSNGFVTPCEHASHGLVHSVAGYQLICWQTADKILPSAVINEALAVRVEQIEEQQGSPVGRQQKREIKELVTQELLVQAFIARRRTFALIGGGYLIIDTSSQPRAEALLGALSKTLDCPPVKLVQTNVSASAAMTSWLAGGEAPDGLTIDRDCELVSGDEGKVRYVDHHLEGDEIRAHIADGKAVTRLGLTYADKVSFVLAEQMHLKRIVLLDFDVAIEAKEAAEDAAEIFDADITIAAGELIRLLDNLVACLGGWVKPEPDLIDGQGETKPDKMAELNDRLSELAPDVAYKEAKKVVLESGRVSISLVQRHLRIGYSRAAGLIVRMEAEGIVSAMDSRGVREVLETSA